MSDSLYMGTTIHDEVVEMTRVRGSSWKLTLDGQQHGPLQSFAACVIVSQRLIPVHRRREHAEGSVVAL